MFDPIELGKAAAGVRRTKTQQARSGRNVKGDNMQKQLHAAGKPQMNTPGVFAFPRGSKV
jgi:hypothetical protein